MRPYNPGEAFFLQWHITDACNLKCAHCYRELPKADLSLHGLESVFANFRAFRATLPQKKARVQITGGEPLLSKNLFAVLDMVAGAGFQSRILTNGTLIDGATAKRIARHGCRIVQISIEGDREAHESIRGAGTFDKSIAGATALRREGVQVTFAMTLSRANMKDVPRVLELARTQADRVSFHRLVACGSGRKLATTALRPHELRRVFRFVWGFRRRAKSVEVPLRDPLWKPFIGCDGPAGIVDGCSAAYGGICVDADGSVYPCRRMPVGVGNALADSLSGLWRAPLMESLRDRDLLKGSCGRCSLRWHCGGCRAVAYARSGDPLAADPQCFYRPGLVEKTLRRVSSALRGWRSCDAATSGGG
ncbi:MAG: radical SAM protein [Planctomycetota bacterium]|nr:radical SAM protein [Planctomycetota bacterium]